MVVGLVSTVDRILAKHALSDEDARSAGLRNIRSAFENAAMILNVLSLGEDGLIDDASLRGLLGVSSGPTATAVKVLEQSARLTLTLLYQFQLENLFKNLFEALEDRPPPRSFYSVASHFSERLDNNSRKLDLLNVPAWIRNSLHRNGVHYGYKGASKSVRIGAAHFEFMHGRKVSCGGWWHIVVALGASLAVVREVVDLPIVEQLEDPVLDVYSSDRAREMARDGTLDS